MTAKELYIRTTGNKEPDEAREYDKWFKKYVEWLENKVQFYYRVAALYHLQVPQINPIPNSFVGSIPDASYPPKDYNGTPMMNNKPEALNELMRRRKEFQYAEYKEATKKWFFTCLEEVIGKSPSVFTDNCLTERRKYMLDLFDSPVLQGIRLDVKYAPAEYYMELEIRGTNNPFTGEMVWRPSDMYAFDTVWQKLMELVPDKMVK